MTTIYRLVADDDEAWYDLGHYASKNEAEADRETLEATYPGRPYWLEFRVEPISVRAIRSTYEELADALVAVADRSEIDGPWRDANDPDSYLSEHGVPRPAARPLTAEEGT